MIEPKHDYAGDKFYEDVFAFAFQGMTDAEVAYSLGLTPEVFSRMKNGKYEGWNEEENDYRSERLSQVLVRARMKVNSIVRGAYLKGALGGKKIKSITKRYVQDRCLCEGKDKECVQCGGTGWVQLTDKAISQETEAELPPNMQALSTWLVGHFSMVLKGRYEIVYMVVPLIIIAFIFANHFNIVGMGKDFSKNLGVPYNLVLFAGLTIAAMITASIIVVVGSISYIGLIVPNVVAMFKGDKIRGTLVDTALFGALFVLVCDIIGRVIIMPYELPIELIVGILGSLIFVALLIYRLKHGRKIVNIKLFNEQKEVNNEQEKKYI